jgi:hypothetical protein
MIKTYMQSRVSRNYVLCSSWTLFCVFNYPLRICIPQINLQIFTLRDVALSLQLFFSVNGCTSNCTERLHIKLRWMVANQTALNGYTSYFAEWLHIKLRWKAAHQTALNACTSNCAEWLHIKLRRMVAHETAPNGCTSNCAERLHIKLHWMVAHQTALNG